MAGVGDWRRQAEKVYENIGHVLRAAGATPASVVKETTWVLDIAPWREHGRAGAPRLLRRRPPRPPRWWRSPGWRRLEFLVEIEVIAAVA